MWRAAAGIGGLFAGVSLGCLQGASPYRALTHAPLVAEFAAAGCPIDSGMSLPLSAIRVRMVQGRSDFSLLLVRSTGDGLEVENHWLDAGVHYFAMVREHKGWRFEIPDKRGADGRVVLLKDMTRLAQESATRIDGTIHKQCALRFVALGEAELAEPSETPGEPGLQHPHGPPTKQRK